MTMKNSILELVSIFSMVIMVTIKSTAIIMAVFFFPKRF